MGLKNNKVGSCEINSIIIKHLAPQIIIPMTQLVNIILTQHYFPNCLKTAKLIPLPKIRKPQKNEDYRPISLQSTLSKVVEKVLLHQI